MARPLGRVRHMTNDHNLKRGDRVRVALSSTSWLRGLPAVVEYVGAGETAKIKVSGPVEVVALVLIKDLVNLN